MWCRIRMRSHNPLTTKPRSPAHSPSHRPSRPYHPPESPVVDPSAMTRATTAVSHTTVSVHTADTPILQHTPYGTRQSLTKYLPPHPNGSWSGRHGLPLRCTRRPADERGYRKWMWNRVPMEVWLPMGRFLDGLQHPLVASGQTCGFQWPTTAHSTPPTGTIRWGPHTCANRSSPTAQAPPHGAH